MSMHERGAQPVEVNEELTKLLLLIDQLDTPVGSRLLVPQLQAQGLIWSEATMARRLRELDALGMTRKVGSKGRVATTAGRSFSASVRRGEHSAEQFLEAATIRSAEDVLHLLRARRAIEPEGASGAAAAFDGAIDPHLTDLVQLHRAAIENDGPVPRNLAMSFHRELARFTPNPIVRVMLDIVLGEEMDSVERILDAVLETNHKAADSAAEHERILTAMADRDVDLVAELMQQHLDRLIDEVLTFLDENGPDIIDRMLDSTGR